MSAKPRTEAQKRERGALRRAVGARLKAVREVLGLPQGVFGRRAGLSPAAYNNIELGEKLPSIETAIALCKAHRLTLDYIFMGDAGDLPHAVGKAIESLQDARTTQASGLPARKQAASD